MYIYMCVLQEQDKNWINAHLNTFLNSVSSFFTDLLTPTLSLVSHPLLLLLIFEKILLKKNFFVHWTVCFFYIGLGAISILFLFQVSSEMSTVVRILKSDQLLSSSQHRLFCKIELEKISDIWRFYILFDKTLDVLMC